MSSIKVVMHLQTADSSRVTARTCVRWFLVVCLAVFGGGAAWAGGGATSGCPATEFGQFLGLFTEDSRLQMAHTRFPLKRMHLINADPEPKPTYQMLSKNEIKLPLIPNAHQRKKEELDIKVASVEKSAGKAVLYKKDTGYLVNFYFEKNSCWTLVFIEDWSI